MKSRASFKGHPIHPALIPFPIAFLSGAFFFDLVGVILDHPALWTTGRYLAAVGIIMGLIAAVPGSVDFLFTIPPRSSGKQRGLKHGLSNVTAVVLFLIAFLVRPGADAPGALVLVIEAIGLVALAAGGWMGGTLVMRNQIGVDHRYAQAGQWREQHVPAAQPLVLARPKDLQVDQLMLLHADGRRIVLGRTADGFVAFDDHCTHRGGPLSDGVMMCGTVQCPWHGSQFDVRTGEVRAGPANEKISAYPVEEVGNQLRIHVTGAAQK